MSFRLVIHEEAYRELDEAERYIEARRSGYGRKFRAEVDHCLRFIQERPTGYALRCAGFRYGSVARFSYRVIYRVLGKQVIIYVVADGRRDMQAVLSRRLLGG